MKMMIVHLNGWHVIRETTGKKASSITDVTSTVLGKGMALSM
jgi:hypothetical protein